MRRTIIILGIAMGVGVAHAQWVVPIFGLTDEEAASIDLRDGSVAEWEEIVGRPTLTVLDFQSSPGNLVYDPASMDYRIWLAWHRSHLYVAMERVDDVYVNEYTGPDGPPMRRYDSSVQFLVDGDHSGGVWLPPTDCCTEEEWLLSVSRHAQPYTAIAEVLGTGLQTILRDFGYSADWFNHPPYTDGGGAVWGDGPVLSVTEFYVTPFDQFVWDAPEQCRVSELFPEKIIGIALRLDDGDDPYNVLQFHDGRVHDFPAGLWENTINADSFADALLLPSGDYTAVEALSWGYVKSSSLEPSRSARQRHGAGGEASSR